MEKFSLRQKIRNWLFNDNDSRVEKERLVSVAEADVSLHGDPIRLCVYVANGGTIIESRIYDPVKDHHRTSLYVINNELDLGQELAKIITMTSLGR